MKVVDIDLGIDYSALKLSTPLADISFRGFILQNYEEYNKDRLRPAVIILPGGGYGMTSEREATPIAMEYLASGVTAFVLRYSCAPSVYPTQLVEVATAVRAVRERAGEYNVDPSRIFVCGFSAGGHLAASISTLHSDEVLTSRGFTDSSHIPNGSILCYPVISGIVNPHQGSFINLLGLTESDLADRTDEVVARFRELSLETRVDKQTIPSLIWHTFEDDVVPVQNALVYSAALANHKIPFELHIYPHGGHGLSLSNHLTCDHLPQGVLRCREWINLSKEFIWGRKGFDGE